MVCCVKRLPSFVASAPSALETMRRRELDGIEGRRQQCCGQANLYRGVLSTLAAGSATGIVRCLLWLSGFG